MSYGCLSRQLAWRKPSGAKAIIQEAEAHNGPSIIMAIVACIAHGIKGDMRAESTKHSRFGYWPHRYNPNSAEKPFYGNLMNLPISLNSSRANVAMLHCKRLLRQKRKQFIRQPMRMRNEEWISTRNLEKSCNSQVILKKSIPEGKFSFRDFFI